MLKYNKELLRRFTIKYYNIVLNDLKRNCIKINNSIFYSIIYVIISRNIKTRILNLYLYSY